MITEPRGGFRAVAAMQTQLRLLLSKLTHIVVSLRLAGTHFLPKNKSTVSTLSVVSLVRNHDLGSIK